MLQNSEGKKVPQVTFKTRTNDAWLDVTSGDIFDGKTVVVFSLPGAFTPTCSSSHVPRYNALAPAFKDLGVDEIVCVSVNDTFVMNAWAEDQNAENIRFIPDGNGEFSEGMGMLVDKANLGFGKRSWRYSMLVRDGIVEKMFIEPEVEGDPFEVSDADTMIKYLNPNVELPKPITVFTKVGCPHCARAKALLTDKGLSYEEIALGGGVSTDTITAVTGKTSVPQVFIGGQYIGGADELTAHLGA